MTLPAPSKTFKLSDQSLLQLALQVAMDIASIEVIAREAGITPDYYEKEVVPNPFYQKVLQQYRIEWGSVKNTPERVKWKAQALIEMGLPTIGARMLDTDEALPAVTEAAKLVSRLAGVDDQKGAAGSGEKFTITINLGEDNTLTVEKSDPKTISGPALPALGQGESSDIQVQQQPESARSGLPVLALPQGDRSNLPPQPHAQTPRAG